MVKEGIILMAKPMSKKAKKLTVHVWKDLNASSINKKLFSKQIERRYGLSGAEIRSIIHQLRLEGKPVCSGDKGYWLAHSLIDARSTINHLRSRARSMMEIANSIESNLKKEEQQGLL